MVIIGNCSDVCARLTITSNITDFYQNSNVTFHATIETNLLAPAAANELGFFTFLKDGDHINNFNRFGHTTITSPNLTLYIYNSQLSDSGVYQFVYVSSHAELYTNRLSININPNSTRTTTTKSSKYNYSYFHLLLRIHVYL